MGKFFDNLKIRQKLVLAFGIILVLTAIMAVYSIYCQAVTTQKMTELAYGRIMPMQLVINTRDDFKDVNMILMESIAVANVQDGSIDTTALRQSLKDSVTTLNGDFDALKEYIETNEHADNMDPQVVVALQDAFNTQYLPIGRKIVQEIDQGDYNGALSYVNDIRAAQEAIETPMNARVEEQIAGSVDDLKVMRDALFRSVRMTAVITLIVFIFSIGVTIIVSNNLAKKIKALSKSVKGISQGDFSDTVAFNSRDEIGELSQDLLQSIDTIHEMVYDTKEEVVQQGLGNTKHTIDVDKYEGEYKEMMAAVNEAFATSLNENRLIMEVLAQFSQGNFEAEIEQFKGDKAIVNQCIDDLRNNLNGVNEEIEKIVFEASKGNLKVKAEAENYQGDWSKLLIGLNELLDAIITPINETRDVLVEMSRGNLGARLVGEYQGEFDVIKRSANTSMEIFAGYINMIDEVLGSIIDNDLTNKIDEEFVGDFNNLKVAINSIIDRLNEIFKEFLVGADEVSIGAQQISNSSISLADGAAEQVTSLSALTKAVAKVHESSSNNAQSASKANEISEKSKDNAITGDKQMKQMLVSMDEISESSNEISNIIKVIEDIAFQTNLLALNAAVEAARAGVHGKGFAVVAEEVRTLAARSSQAAKETTELIQTSISRVSFGSDLAKATASALDEIVNNVTDVAEIIEEISAQSKEQSNFVDRINEEIGVVENVVLKTSAASEEGVSTAEELSSQSTVLRDLIGTFKLHS